MDHGQRQPGLEDEYNEAEDTSEAFAYQAAREEEARHRRYVEATRMRSGEVQGYYFAGDVPAVPDAIERADPALLRRGNERDMLHRGPSLEDLLAHKDSSESTGSASAVVLSPPLAPGELAPAGIAGEPVHPGGRLPCIYEAGSEAASFSAHGGAPAAAAAAVPAGAVPVRVDPQGLRAEPLEATAAAMAAATAVNHMHSGGPGAPRPVAAAVDMHTIPAPLHPSGPFHQHQHRRHSGGSTPSSPTSPNTQPTSPNQITATRRPSEKLGSSLGASERERAELTAAADASTLHQGRNEGAVARSGEKVGATGGGAAAAAGAGRGDGGSFEERPPSEVLADLPPAQQMVLEFKNVCSWVQVGNYAQAPKKSLKEQLKPSNLATACFKPVKDTFKSAAGAGRSAGKAAGGAARKLGGIVHRGKKGEEDIETGKADHASLSGAQTIAGHRQILYNVTGHVKPGEVLALMGPSGSGKTSVLSILGGRAPKGAKLEGQLLVNGLKMNKAMRRRVGFVLQDDVLYETLTVQETLQYAGLLRLPKVMSRAEKMARVDAVMAVLGLTKSKDTIIGGYFRRGVSGGERKRVSVGHELLINPAVLMLDEPTSGLDSTTALHLVSLLKDLARGGRAILTTIHQPSSRLYRQLDKVMLLAEGHVMYYGDALRAVDWFDHLGFGLPYGTNLADHILDCAMGEVTYDPSAPGAHQQSGEQDGKDITRRMHGPVAIKSLYQTFEAWFATHPEGFSTSRRGNTTQTAAPGLPSVLAHSQQGSHTNKDDQHDHDHSSNQDTQSISSISGAHLADMLGDLKLQPSANSRRSLQSPPGSGNNKPGAKSGAGPVAESTTESTSGSEVQRVTADGQQPRLTSDGVVQVGGANGVTTAQGGAASHHVVPMGVEKGSDTGLRMRGSSSGGSSTSEADHDAVQGLERSGASFVTQVSVLWQRAVKVRRFESLSGQNLMQLIVVAAITGLLWWQRGRTSDIAGGADITGLLFFEMLFVAFRSLFSSLFTFPNEFRMLSKERPSGMYKLSAYYAARTFADLPIEILLPTIFIVIVYWFGGLRADAGAFFSNWAAVLLIVMVAQSWGLLIGGLFMDPKLAQTMTTIIILTFMLVGGFYVKDVPVWIGWLKYLSFVYWGFNLLLKIEFRGRTFTDCTQAGPIGGCAAVSSIQDALRLPVNPDSSVWLDVVVLLGMLVLLRTLTYIVLRWKTASSQRSL